MNKKLLLFAFIFKCLIVVAENTNVTLRVELKDGTTNDYIIAERPAIKFESGKIIFTCKSITTEYIETDVIRFSFLGEGTGISELKVGDTRVHYSDDKLVIEGVTEVDQILVFSLDGKRQPATVNKPSKHIEVSLEGLSMGCYVIKIGNKQSIKVLKK